MPMWSRRRARGRLAGVAAVMAGLCGTGSWAVPVALGGPGLLSTRSARAEIAAPPVQLGDPAPALGLDGLAHDPVSLASLRGQVVVVQFFATWCEPCHRAFADLLAVRADPRLTPAQRPSVVLVDLEESPELVARWVAEARLEAAIAIAIDRNGTAAARWGVNRLPTVFVLDGAGIVRHINRGWGEGYRERLRRWLSAPTAARHP